MKHKQQKCASLQLLLTPSTARLSRAFLARRNSTRTHRSHAISLAPSGNSSPRPKPLWCSSMWSTTSISTIDSMSGSFPQQTGTGMLSFNAFRRLLSMRTNPLEQQKNFFSTPLIFMKFKKIISVFKKN